MNSAEKNSMSETQTEKLSVEKIIDLVRQVRNDLVKDFLIKDNAQNYFAEHYNKPLSKIKLEFLRRDLSELLISPVTWFTIPLSLKKYAKLIALVFLAGTINFFIRNWN
jgi:hypothetical protein